MIFRITICAVFFLITSAGTISAQQFVRGRIYDKKKDKVLASVTVRNYSQKIVRQSDFGGNYKINAAEDDVLIFSSISYLPDTVRVTSLMLTNTYDISLEQNPELLQSVMVGEYNNYQLDSLSRREEYQKFYDSKKAKLIDNSSTGSFGLKLSPVSFFSKKEKQKRTLLRRLQYNEEQYYIDFRFATTYVSRLTALQGDSLHTFMLRYRPTYSYTRKSTQEDMLLYINDNYKLFKLK